MNKQSKRWILALVIGFSLAAYVRAADEDYTPEKIAALIKDLANEAFEKRQAAEKELIKAGMKAEKALKEAAASADPQVKLSAEKLLGRLRVLNLGAVNYLEVIPEHSIFAIQVKDVRDYGAKLAKTPFGKIIMGPAFEPVRADFEKNLAADAHFKEFSEKILGSMGQVGGAFWGVNLAKMEIRAAAIVEIKGDAKIAFQFFKSNMLGGQTDTSTYKEVEIVESGAGQGALALAGSHILVAPNVESLQPLIDNIVKPSGLRATADFKRAEKYGVQDPDTFFAVNMQAYVKLLTTAMPFEMPGLDDIMEAGGMKEMGLSVWSSKLTEDGSEERWVTMTTGKPVGYTAAMIPPKDAPAPIETMNLVPANAAAALVYYVDGEKMIPFFTKYFEGMKKMQDFGKQFGGAPAQGQPDFLEMLTKGEEKVGFKVADIMKNVNGEVAYWMTLGTEVEGLAPPDIGALMTAGSPENAKTFSDQVAKIYNAIAGKDIVTQSKFKERTIYNIELNDLGANVPVALPYSLCWAVEGNRIFMASSPQALQRQLTNMDEKKPGLPTNEVYKKALEMLNPEEKKGALAYVDFPDLAMRGALIGLMEAKSIQGLDQPLKDAIGKLPPVKGMFKDMKPIIMTMDMQDDRHVFLMKSPAPVTGVLAAVIAGVVGYQRKMARIPLDQPPGGF